MIRAAQLVGWTPIRFYLAAARPRVDWCDMSGVRFTDPFFDQSVERALRRPFSLLFRPQTSFETLAEFAATEPCLRPAGFIFHLSRCGSTVISQMLAALAQNVVVAEATAVDAVMRANFRRAVTDAERGDWLRALLLALGQRRHAAERHYFVKFDGWQTLALPLVRATFPDVPWLFVYRAPLEVMSSQLSRPARWMRPGDLPAALVGLDESAAFTLSPAEYCARVLARICETALGHARDGRMLLVNHNELPAVVTGTLPDFFRVTYTAQEREVMRQTAQFHAKEPEARYADDSELKRRAAVPAAQAAAERWLSPLYERLEMARRAALEFTETRPRVSDLPAGGS